MKISELVALLVVLLLSACNTSEVIRLRSNGPSPAADHCPECMDLGQAWALFRMGHYDQVEELCALVSETEPSGSRHAQRAHDIEQLSKGFMAMQAGDHSSAGAYFRSIHDPLLRSLGPAYVDEAREPFVASATREPVRASPESRTAGEAAR